MEATDGVLCDWTNSRSIARAVANSTRVPLVVEEGRMERSGHRDRGVGTYRVSQRSNSLVVKYFRETTKSPNYKSSFKNLQVAYQS